jgi:hypothetical protein
VAVPRQPGERTAGVAGAPDGAEAGAKRRLSLAWGAVALALLAGALYAPNWNDYFLGDDFDLIGSFYGKPPSYFLALLWSNESGDVWKGWGIDPELGRGYLRPVKIWLLALDARLWGTNALGFHLTSTCFFVALVLLAFGILRHALPGRPLLAFAGGCSVALHPVFAEVVPFITAREEIVTAAFGLAAVLAFLRARASGGSLLPFHAFFALALFTKEWALALLALPLAWDLLQGRLLPRTGRQLRSLALDWAPSAVVLATYFLLRLVAFGNLQGGDGEPTAFLELQAFLRYHALFFQSLADPTRLAAGEPAVVGGAVAVALAGLLFVTWRRRALLPEGRLRLLVLLGPIWYLSATAIFHGIHFAGRHQVMAVTGLLLFVVVLLDSLLVGASRRREAFLAAGAVLLSATLFLPPSLAASAEFREASRVVAAQRAEIEARTAHLPPGSTVSVEGVPQLVFPPFYFGWGFLSALKRPFTETDLARHSTVVNQRNLLLTRAPRPQIEHFDLEIRFDPREWATGELQDRQALRARREGYSPRAARGAGR